MARVGNLCAIGKIPGRESTRLKVNDSMVVRGTIISEAGGRRGRYDDSHDTAFS